MLEYLILIFISLVFPIGIIAAVLIQNKKDKKRYKQYDKKTEIIKEDTKTHTVDTINIDNFNRQFQESYNIITTSKNPETVLSRLTYIESVYLNLKRTASKNKSWQYYSNLYSDLMANRDRFVDNAIQRGYEQEILKTDDLSTSSGKIRRLRNYLDKLRKIPGLSAENESYIQQLSDNTEKNLLDFQNAQISKYEALDKQQQEISDNYYKKHLQNIADFDTMNIDTSITGELSNAELNFLSYINGKSVYNTDIAQYWEYEFSLNYKQTMSRFFNMGYLKVSTAKETLAHLKLQELKQILKSHNLKVSGKKDELVKRILETFSDDELEQTIPNNLRCYQLTKEGFDVADTAKPLREEPQPLSYEDECKNVLETLKSFKSMGADSYEFSIIPNGENCTKCKKLDGKIFKIGDAKIGINCPPMHKGCICMILPHYDDEYSDLFK